MRTRAAFLTLALTAIGTAALAQRPAPAHRGSGASSATASHGDGGAPARDASLDASGDATAATTTATATPVSGDGGASATGATANTFNIPMTQRGQGAMVHYPIPEQLARTEVPVFVQVRSSAPIDHVSMFYRGQGASRYREVRMTSMGANLQLPGGYGVSIPCEDAFPPAVEYYVQAIDTSGAVIGSAGTTAQPISLPIVRERTQQFIPSLPGQPPPHSCGSLTTPVATTTGGTGTGARGRDAGPAVEERGTADMGEPCTRDNDCRHGLRCGTNHLCVFVGGGH